MVLSIVSPAPGEPNAASLLSVIRRWCSPSVANDVQVMDQRVYVPWHVVRALLLARNQRPISLVVELNDYGHVLVDDTGLTIVANVR
jgi:hypothetical protein